MTGSSARRHETAELNAGNAGAATTTTSTGSGDAERHTTTRQVVQEYLTLAGRGVNSIGALGISVEKSRPADFHGLKDYTMKIYMRVGHDERSGNEPDIRLT